MNTFDAITEYEPRVCVQDGADTSEDQYQIGSDDVRLGRTGRDVNNIGDEQSQQDGAIAQDGVIHTDAAPPEYACQQIRANVTNPVRVSE